MSEKKTDEQPNQLEVVRKKANQMQKMVDDSPITNEEELAEVSDKVSKVKKLQSFIKQEKDKLVAPAKAIIAEAKEKYDPLISKCKDAESDLKSRAKDYMLKEEKKRRDAEDKIAAKVGQGKMTTDKAVEKMEKLPEVQKKIVTDNGSKLQLKKRKVAVIVDTTLVPKEYWVIDEVRVRKMALEMHKTGQTLPGVEIREESSMSV